MSTPAQTLYSGAYKRFREYLRILLRPMLEMIEKSDDPEVGHPILRKKGPSLVVRELSQQIDMFWRDEYPFHNLGHETINDPFAWWQDLAKHNHAQVLRVSVLIIHLLNQVGKSLTFNHPRSS